MSRRLGGRLAQSHGAGFERVFMQMCAMHRVGCVQIPAGCRTAGKRLVRVKSPCDYVISYANVRTVIDCKSLEGGNFTFSHVVPHQLNTFRTLQSGGYVLRLKDQVYFIPWQVLDKLKPRDSVNLEDCVHLGKEYIFNPRLIF